MQNRNSVRWAWAACTLLLGSACGGPDPQAPPAANPTLEVHVASPLWNGSSAGVAGVQVHVTSIGTSLDGVTDASGRADFGALPAGEYTIAVSKSDGAEAWITQSDVDVLVRYLAAESNLSDLQLEQADLDRSGSVTAYDLQILRRWLAGERTAGREVGTWHFWPPVQPVVLESARSVHFETRVLGDIDLAGPSSGQP